MEYLLISREKPEMFKWKETELAGRDGVKKKCSNLKGGSLLERLNAPPQFFGYIFSAHVQFKLNKKNIKLGGRKNEKEKFQQEVGVKKGNHFRSQQQYNGCG